METAVYTVPVTDPNSPFDDRAVWVAGAGGWRHNGAMVEPVSLTLGAMVAGFVAKAAEKAIEKTADGAVEAVPGAVSKVVAWVKTRFAGRTELARLEDAPDSARRQQELGQIIDAELVDDERTELQTLVDQAQAAAPSDVFNIGSVRADRGVAVVKHIGDITMNYDAGSGGSDPR